ncbi:MAG: type II secretion system protein [Betaproteobacteria bacterium]|nr:MAG: type II secretion system protein [Betaproteobacteria bacterium]
MTAARRPNSTHCRYHRPVRRMTGFTYMAVLLALAILGAAAAATGVVWHVAQKREKERELLFVGDQFRKAIAAYVRNRPRGVATVQYPRYLSELLQDPRYPGVRRYLRKIYIDPMTNKPEWGLVRAPDGGIMGVHSMSEETPLKTANFEPGYAAFEGSGKYSEWRFMHAPYAPPPRPTPVTPAP